MKNAVDRDRIVFQCDLCALAGIPTDSDDSLRSKNIDNAPKRFITCLLQGLPLLNGQLVGCTISPGFLEKCQRAPVPDEEAIEERVGSHEAM